MDKNTASAFKLEDVSNSAGFPLWTLTFDLPGEKVNKFSRAVMEEFETVISQLEALGSEGRIQTLMLQSGKPAQFIAGADINMIQSARSEAEAQALSAAGHALLNRWED